MPPPGHHDTIRFSPAFLDAVGALGDAIRDAGSVGWCTSLLRGGTVERSTFVDHVGVEELDALLVAGLGSVADGEVSLAVVVVEVAGTLAVIPKRAWSDETVYLGPDSAHLAEAVLRLAPRGDRAADLGTGTGLLAALAARRYRTVVATDVAPSVAAAAALTLALNRYPEGHHAAAVVADVGAGLREDAFDLVAANAPWVPLADASAEPRDLFAHGGDVGIELPRRFVLDGAALLRPGGVAISLALDVTLDDAGRGHGDSASEGGASRWSGRPLGRLVSEIEGAGFVVAVVPTPFNAERPNLLDVVRRRQPRIVAATHVALVVARPRWEGDDRGSLLVAVEALRARWADRPVSPAATAAAGR